MKSFWLKIIIGLFLVGIISFELYFGRGHEKMDSSIYMRNFTNLSIEDFYQYAEEYDLLYEVEYQYDSRIDKDKIISQSILEGNLLEKGMVCKVIVSKGRIPDSVYIDKKVNELGKVPIMMYHGIIDMKSSDTKYIGGNVDKDGYNRTVEAFREDLEFYYQSGYRMISLNDYIIGNIDVELGYSPIILTFDDGNENNFKVLEEVDGELVIDPDCAVGVLEEFKKKYPDYGVTATFFVNSGLFGQDKYNEKILKWLVKHGYDVGNHSMTHPDFTKISKEETSQEIGGLYQILERIIPKQYVSIVALPFGSPYQTSHSNYSFIMDGNYQGISYHTKASLRVGWEAEVSCFAQDFNPSFLKRIRAYDNHGVDFDIEMNFKLLEDSRYISDGDVDTIVIRKSDVSMVSSSEKEVIVY